MAMINNYSKTTFSSKIHFVSAGQYNEIYRAAGQNVKKIHEYGSPQSIKRVEPNEIGITNGIVFCIASCFKNMSNCVMGHFLPKVALNDFKNIPPKIEKEGITKSSKGIIVGGIYTADTDLYHPESIMLLDKLYQSVVPENTTRFYGQVKDNKYSYVSCDMITKPETDEHFIRLDMKENMTPEQVRNYFKHIYICPDDSVEVYGEKVSNDFLNH